MKSFTNFTIFFILLIAGIGAFTFLTLDISEILQYVKADEIEKATHLSLIVTYNLSTIGTIMGGSFISVFLYQIKRIADNTEKPQSNKMTETNENIEQ